MDEEGRRAKVPLITLKARMAKLIVKLQAGWARRHQLLLLLLGRDILGEGTTRHQYVLVD